MAGRVRERIDIKSTGGRTEIHVLRPAGVTSRVIGFKVEADDLFTGAGAVQSRAMRIQGDRAAANVMGGDAHDWLLEGAYTNRAVNTPAGSYCRSLSFAVQNRGSGEIGSMQAALFSTRQRGDGGAVPEQRVLRADLTHDVGGAVSTGLQECFRANIKIHANGATHSDTAGPSAIVANNDATGSYTNKPRAYAVRSLGQPFSYGVDFYDSRVTGGTCVEGEIRMMTADAASLPCIIASGVATSDGAIKTDVDAGGAVVADGSLYVSVVDTGGLLFMKQNGTWTDIS